MKRFGYTPAFAGGVEATASHGRADHAAGDGRGRLHHGRDAQRALRRRSSRPRSFRRSSTSRPAFWMVHLEAGSAACIGMPKRRAARARGARSSSNWYLMLPLAVLVYLLFAGFTPLFAGIGRPGADRRADPRRRASPPALAIAGPAGRVLDRPRAARRPRSLASSVTASCRSSSSIALLVVVEACRPGRPRDASAMPRAWPTARGRRSRSASPARSSASSSACMTLTGVGTNFGNWIDPRVGKDSLFLSLLLTMIVCLILGMGIPTIPNYIITVVARRARAAEARRAADRLATCSCSISASWPT